MKQWLAQDTIQLLPTYFLPIDFLIIFSKSFEILLLKLFQGKLPQNVIEPVEKTEPPPGTSK